MVCCIQNSKNLKKPKSYLICFDLKDVQCNLTSKSGTTFGLNTDRLKLVLGLGIPDFLWMGDRGVGSLKVSTVEIDRELEPSELIVQISIGERFLTFKLLIPSRRLC